MFGSSVSVDLALVHWENNYPHPTAFDQLSTKPAFLIKFVTWSPLFYNILSHRTASRAGGMLEIEYVKYFRIFILSNAPVPPKIQKSLHSKSHTWKYSQIGWWICKSVEKSSILHLSMKNNMWKIFALLQKYRWQNFVTSGPKTSISLWVLILKKRKKKRKQ